MDFTKLRFTIAADKDVPALRRLVNAAYQGLADLGLNFTGTFQDEELTRERMQGIRRIKLDTAAPATHLGSFYRREGYRICDKVQWDGKIYQSYIMEKTL